MTKARDTEIISVGTELLLGRVVNTDARDISEMLSKIGINVKYHTVVGDNPQRLRDCVNIAKDRADIIVTTGGLGPTCDDLTKQILAEAGVEIPEETAIEVDAVSEGDFEEAYAPESEEEDSKEV